MHREAPVLALPLPILISHVEKATCGELQEDNFCSASPVTTAMLLIWITTMREELAHVPLNAFLSLL